MRVVLDTNVLIDAGADDLNAQSRLLEAVVVGEMTAVASPAVLREYRKIIGRLVADDKVKARLEEFVAAVEPVAPKAIAGLVIDDEEDRKILQAAVGGEAQLVVTSDRHLLDVGEVGEIRVVRPREAWLHFEDEEESGRAWQEFARGMGIGK